MKLKIYEKEIDKQMGKKFALFPTVVTEAHPTHSTEFLIWLEWYEIDAKYGSIKWLIIN